MRDPARIQRILSKFQAAWEQHPDLRFNQLVYNLVYHETKASPGPFINNFYLEDDRFEELLNKELPVDYVI